MNAKRWILAALGGVLVVSVGLCLVKFPIFPVPPPDELERIQVGMTSDEVVAIWGRQPDRRENDDFSWLIWNVSDGVVSIHLDNRRRVDMASFHASRSSVVEEYRHTMALLRRAF